MIKILRYEQVDIMVKLYIKFYLFMLDTNIKRWYKHDQSESNFTDSS